MKKAIILLTAALGFAQPAWADNVAHCEALIMQAIPSEDGQGEAQIASYRPAVGFLASLYDEDSGHLSEIDGFPIRAIMCRRIDVIPSKTDYPILATGLPFILSQDFDSPDTDSLTVFWKDDALDYVYKGHPLSKESQTILETRLAEFSKRGKNAPLSESNDDVLPDASNEILDMADDVDIEGVSEASVEDSPKDPEESSE